jgi:anti-sigma B factor antagonist
VALMSSTQCVAMDLDDVAERSLSGRTQQTDAHRGDFAARPRAPWPIAFPGARAAAAPRSAHHTVRTAVHGDRLAVHVVGELDVSTIGSLREVLIGVIAADFTDLVVVLTGVSFVDSTGLGVLVSAHKKALSRGGRVELVVSHESVMKVLRITALNQVFALHPTLDAALAA